MTRLPQRQSLIQQLGDILREEIDTGRWGAWLPEERELAKLYQVSRSTVRGALIVLRGEGRLETQHGLGTRVAAPRKRGRPKLEAHSIGILLPKSLYQFRHFVTLVVDDLREQLFDHGCRLQLHEHPQVAARRPFQFLHRLIAQHQHSSWALIGCGANTQRWFAENHVPAVVSGTCDPDLGLPFVSLDNHALGRHAALTLIQHRHARVGALLTHSNPGLKAGLVEIFGKSPDASLVVLETDEEVSAVARAVDRLMTLSFPPTAIFVAESNLYLSAFARLTQRGLRIPQDVSLLCRDDEPYLGSLLPAPARYSKDPHLYAKRMLLALLKVMASEPFSQLASRLMPEFVPGGSLQRLDPS